MTMDANNIERYLKRIEKQLERLTELVDLIAASQR